MYVIAPLELQVMHQNSPIQPVDLNFPISRNFCEIRTGINQFHEKIECQFFLIRRTTYTTVSVKGFMCSSDNPLGASLCGLTGNKQMRLTKLEINRLVFVFKRPDVWHTDMKKQSIDTIVVVVGSAKCIDSSKIDQIKIIHISSLISRKKVHSRLLMFSCSEQK